MSGEVSYAAASAWHPRSARARETRLCRWLAIVKLVDISTGLWLAIGGIWFGW